MRKKKKLRNCHRINKFRGLPSDVTCSKIKGCCLAYFQLDSVYRIWRVGKPTECLLPITITAHNLLLMKKSFTKYTSCSGLSLQNISYASFKLSKLSTFFLSRQRKNQLFALIRKCCTSVLYKPSTRCTETGSCHCLP